jgi:hypothetical protein
MQRRLPLFEARHGVSIGRITREGASSRQNRRLPRPKRFVILRLARQRRPILLRMALTKKQLVQAQLAD